eukprot:3215316-Rhodomonas_salina.1
MDSVWQKSVIEARIALTLGATRNRRKPGPARPLAGPGIKFPVSTLWGECQSPLTSISDLATGHHEVSRVHFAKHWHVIQDLVWAPPCAAGVCAWYPGTG